MGKKIDLFDDFEDTGYLGDELGVKCPIKNLDLLILRSEVESKSHLPINVERLYQNIVKAYYTEFKESIKDGWNNNQAEDNSYYAAMNYLEDTIETYYPGEMEKQKKRFLN